MMSPLAMGISRSFGFAVHLIM